jgi:RimJ/RimL family protein N-acetyltransferase
MAMDTSVRLAPVTLEGRHVRLEPLSAGHAAALLAAARGPRDSYGYTLVPDNEAAMARYIEAALAERDAGRALPFATVDRARARVVGATRFGNVEFWPWPPGNRNQRGPDVPDVVEIGWTWLAADAQRTAVNTEAKYLMLTHAFEGWRVHRVSLQTDARNTRSRAAIERIGARLDGVLRAQRPAADGTVRDSAYYTIVESEWPGVRARLEARLARESSGPPTEPGRAMVAPPR